MAQNKGDSDVMIDFHTHLLPNMDDGAHSLEETKTMLQEAEKAGFTKIILTSHYLEPYYQAKEDEREGLRKQMQEQTKLSLYLASEIYLSENMVEKIQQKEASTIAGTNYLLFELPFHTKPMNLEHCIYTMREKGYRPILAHPERYEFIQKEPELVEALLQKGVLMQGNFGSYIGQYGKKAQNLICKLLFANQIQFLGTDSHRPQEIYQQTPQIIAQLEKNLGKEKVEELTQTNPQKVLENGTVSIEKMEKLPMSFWDKWKR